MSTKGRGLQLQGEQGGEAGGPTKGDAEWVDGKVGGGAREYRGEGGGCISVWVM